MISVSRGPRRSVGFSRFRYEKGKKKSTSSSCLTFRNVGSRSRKDLLKLNVDCLFAGRGMMFTRFNDVNSTGELTSLLYVVRPSQLVTLMSRLVDDGCLRMFSASALRDSVRVTQPFTFFGPYPSASTRTSKVSYGDLRRRFHQPLIQAPQNPTYTIAP